MTTNKTGKVGRKVRHGMTGTRIYCIWQAMKARCLNKNYKDYKDYGRRGITICPEWLSEIGFENFYRDMGDRPEGKTLDRIKNNLGYCKSNCRWSTRIEQMNNTRRNRFLTYNNKTQTIAQWSRELKIDVGIIYYKLKKGQSIKEVLNNYKKL